MRAAVEQFSKEKKKNRMKKKKIKKKTKTLTKFHMLDILERPNKENDVKIGDAMSARFVRAIKNKFPIIQNSMIDK